MAVGTGQWTARIWRKEKLSDSGQVDASSTPKRGIIVGIDGSAAAAQALAWAVDEARLRSTPLKIVSAWETPYLDWGEAFPLPQEPEREALEHARSIAEQAASQVAAQFSELDVSSEAVEGSPAGRLIELSESAELLVVGSRGRGGFAGLILGSVSQQCVAHAHCPVVVVHGSTVAGPPERSGPR